MLNSSIIRTTTFRLALIYLALFGLSVFLLLGFIYWSTAGISTGQTDDTIQAEITGLAEQYRENGLGGLVRIVSERARNQRQSLYLLIDPGGRPVAGNLTKWPKAATGAGGLLEFPYQRPVGGVIESHRARARHLGLGRGFQLLVGRDIQERLQVEQVMRTSLAWAVALTLGLGLLGGVLLSRNLLRRVETINRTSREIMDGALHRRLPVSGSGDELDRLAENLNEMLDQIERLVTGMRQVTDNIAHDLRSPLNRLRGRLEVTLMGAASEADYRAALEETIAESETLLETFNALLNIAQAEAGLPEDEQAEFDLSALVADMAELYGPAAEDKNQSLTGEVEPGISLRGNRHLVGQALANLMDNAVKYTPDGGAIALVLRRVGKAADLIVADSGPGIAEADRQKVLDRFQRLEASRNSPGTGLGLSLVRAVAGLHCAELTLEDNLPGLRVILRFPETAIP
ncbi:MAG: HAMP domain-containing sensor histidine kinase [Rhodospirillales bacterium]|nr:two-component sensor histidine kinase [Rhodospirillaceae bacterium]MDP6426416.1 HAMP domain-containing sensor histidine kinase [Rhodospirillales bacterium]MDP6645763.1 HAMP domain-containing sensor histidine kinase [Rhodospirillales bacterium]MDP6840337.1 HAMP domain-containing sensor histidine kinase [Rhodospirillales bacterium]